MPLVFSDGGQRAKLDQSKAWRNGHTLKLYKNNFLPLRTSVVGDFIEADFPGYSAQGAGPWGDAYTNPDGYAESDSGSHTFTATGPSTPNVVYGYFVVDAGGNLIFAERRAEGPIAMETAGATFTLIPRMTERNQP